MYFKNYNARSYSVNSRFPKTLKLYRQSWGKMSNVFRTWCRDPGELDTITKEEIQPKRDGSVEKENFYSKWTPRGD